MVVKDSQLLPAWWTIDHSREPQLKVGATCLVERCLRAHRWDDAFALRVLKGYEENAYTQEYVSRC